MIEIEKWWIENGEGMKELRDRRNFSFSLVLFGWNHGNDEKLIYFIEKKGEKIENVICLNLLLCPYFIIYKK